MVASARTLLSRSGNLIQEVPEAGRPRDRRKKGSGYFIVAAIVLSERSAKIIA